MVDTARYVHTLSTPGGNGTTNATTGPDRAYASIAEWDANEATTIGVGDRHICNITAPPSNPDESYTNLNGWTVNGELIVQKEPGAPDRPLIKPPSGVSGQVFVVYQNTHFKDLDIDCSLMNNSVNWVFYIEQSNNSWDGIKAWDNAMQDFSYAGGSFNKTNCVFKNCMVWNFAKYGFTHSASSTNNFSWFSCIFWNITMPVFRPMRAASQLTAKNVAGHSPSNPVFDAGGQPWLGDNNISSHPSDQIPGLNSYSGVTFQEGTGGSGDRIMLQSLTAPVDLHLIDDAANIAKQGGLGTNDSDIPPFDIDGDPRGATVADIGADEIVTSGPVIDAQLDLTADAPLTQQAAVEFAAQVGLTADAPLTPQAVAEFAAQVGLTADAALTHQGAAELAAQLGLTADAAIVLLDAGQTVSGQIALNADASLVQQGAVIGLGHLDLDGDASLSCQVSDMVGVGSLALQANAPNMFSPGDTINAFLLLNADAPITQQGAAEFADQFNLMADAALTQQGAAELAAQLGLPANAQITVDGEVIIITMQGVPPTRTKFVFKPLRARRIVR